MRLKRLSVTSLTQAMNVFRDHRALGSNADLFKAPSVQARYTSLRNTFKEGASVTNNDKGHLDQSAIHLIASCTNPARAKGIKRSKLRGVSHA
jgi:hypothetical protein